MVDINLDPGNHNIQMSLFGYEIFAVTINVSTTGIITCIPSDGASCNTTTPPGLTIAGSTITGYLKSSSIASELCSWITTKGGPGGIGAFDIMLLVQDYLGTQEIGFNVSSGEIMGAVAYYLGNTQSGNSLTGCTF